MEETTNAATSGKVVEISPDVTDESTTSSDVTSKETETQDTSTTSDSTDAKVETETPKPIDYEKSYKEIQSAFTRQSQELAKLKKDFEQSKSVVADGGQIKNEVVQRVAQQLALEELDVYRKSLYELDSEVQQDVSNLLNLYQSTGNKNYLSQAKEYYGSNFVGQVEANKTRRAQTLAAQLEQQRNEYQSKVKAEFEEGLKTSCPVAYSYYDKSSPFYCAELAQAISGAIGVSQVADVENAIKNIEIKAIEKYKADLAKIEANQKQVKGLVPPVGNKQQQNTTADVPLAEIKDEKELVAAVNRYI